jgi:hypothetical protein
MEVDGDAEGLWAPEHVRDIRSKEKKEQYEKERVERARRAEEEKAKTLSPCGLEERRRRDIQELSAAHHKDKKDLKTQALLEIQKRKYTIGQRQGDENQNIRQRWPASTRSMSRVSRPLAIRFPIRVILWNVRHRRQQTTQRPKKIHSTWMISLIRSQ